MIQINWKPRVGQERHETFSPFNLRKLPPEVEECYPGTTITDARAYPGPMRQMYGRPVKPRVYILLRLENAIFHAWGLLPSPDKHDCPKWQRLPKNEPWPW